MVVKKPKLTVAGFIRGVENERRRLDCKRLVEVMKEASGERAKLWDSKVIGFGAYHYKYDSGREGDAPLVALVPRKQHLVVYIMPGFANYKALLAKLGKHKTGKSCLYINSLEDVHMPTLRLLIKRSVREMLRRYT